MVGWMKCKVGNIIISELQCQNTNCNGKTNRVSRVTASGAKVIHADQLFGILRSTEVVCKVNFISNPTTFLVNFVLRLS